MSRPRRAVAALATGAALAVTCLPACATSSVAVDPPAASATVPPAAPAPEHPAPPPAREPVPAVERVQGAYESDWGRVDLVQDGARVTGTYHCCGGGTIEGTLDGKRLEYRWQDGAGRGGGRGVWHVDDGAYLLRGTWGQGESAIDGGRWDLTAIPGPIGAPAPAPAPVPAPAPEGAPR